MIDFICLGICFNLNWNFNGSTVDASLISGFWNHPSGVINFSHLTDQKTTEGGGVFGCPNMTVCRQAHKHLVPLLQLHECCISSIISCVRGWFVIRRDGNDVAVLHQPQPWLMFSSSMIEEGKIINTCNRCSEDTCGNKKVFIRFKGFWKALENLVGT